MCDTAFYINIYIYIFVPASPLPNVIYSRAENEMEFDCFKRC